MIAFRCLGSSSQGNAYLLESGGKLLLIDAGLSCRRTVKGIKEAGYSPEQLVGVLLTHDHRDHTDGLPQLLKQFPALNVFANRLTIEQVCKELRLTMEQFWEFENGQEIEVEGISAESFKTAHDAADSVGYLVRDGETVYFHATDLGIVDATIGGYFVMADRATLESNHDLMMLKCSGRDRRLINRICGSSGHLSNDQAADFVRKYAPEATQLRQLQLAHLSRDCNTPEIARKSMAETLAEIGRQDIELSILT